MGGLWAAVFVQVKETRGSGGGGGRGRGMLGSSIFLPTRVNIPFSYLLLSRRQKQLRDSSSL